VAGFLTGYVESACVTPFELVKARPSRRSCLGVAASSAPCLVARRALRRAPRAQVRMQVKEHGARYASSLACAKAVVVEEGALALYRGFGATCARNTTFNGVYFGLLFAGQEALPPRAGAADVGQNLALGAASGAAATLLKAPFDVVKSRVQAQLPDAHGRLRYRHTWQAVALVAREEGVAALWKGLGPSTRPLLAPPTREGGADASPATAQCSSGARWGFRSRTLLSMPRSDSWGHRAPRGARLRRR
jgi:solute carrier family 25 2-oxodicarboxylate transporter 21